MNPLTGENVLQNAVKLILGENLQRNGPVIPKKKKYMKMTRGGELIHGGL